MPVFNPGGGLAVGSIISGLTTGSVLFGGASGVLAQDNATFYRDPSTGFVGFGTNLPQASLHVGSLTHTGAVAGDAVIEGRLLLGDTLSGVNYTSGRMLDIRGTPTANVLGMVSFTMTLGSLSGAAGNIRIVNMTMAGTPVYTSGTTISANTMFISNNISVQAGKNANVTGVSLQAAPTEANTDGTGLVTIFGADFNVLGPTSTSSTLVTTKMAGARFQVNNRGKATLLLAGIDIVSATGSQLAAVTDFAAFNLSSAVSATANTVNWSLIRCDQTPTLPTGNKLIFNITSTLPSIHAGSFAIGSATLPTDALEVTGAARITTGLRVGSAATPTHFLQIAAGTTAKAPILLTSGTNLTTATAGAFEYDGTYLYFSPSTTRLAVVQDNGTRLTSGRVPFATTNGFLNDDGSFLYATGTGLTLSATNLITDTTTGMKIGTATGQKLGFWNTAPIVQPSALTTQLTTITFTAPGTPDYAIADLVDSSAGAAFGFSTKDEGNTVLSVIANLQARVQQLENALSTAAGGSGLIA